MKVITVFGLVASMLVAAEDPLGEIINGRRLREPMVVAVVVVSLLVLIGLLVWWAVHVEGGRRDTSKADTSGEPDTKPSTADPDRWWNAG